MDTKSCSVCKHVKPVSDFSWSRRPTETRSGVYRSECRPCNNEKVKTYWRQSPERMRDTKWKHVLKVTYGLTPDQYEQMLQEQGGVCKICGNKEVAVHGRTGTQHRLPVDHCHVTGKVRGLLCHRCNRALGLLGDSVELLEKAIDYLKE